MAIYQPFTGVITKIDDIQAGYGEKPGCNKLMSVVNDTGGIVNFIVLPTTYFVDHETVAVGDTVTGFYDASAPALMIYPPQFPALVMAKAKRNRDVKVAYFNRQLVSSDGALKLNLARSTRIILINDQLFQEDPGNRNLIVVYGPTTRSIPAQTTPYQVIVMC